MLKLVIIEDEELSVKLLLSQLKNLEMPYNVVATLHSLQESYQWFQTNTNYDLILMDIHLPDGTTFNLIEQTNIKAPVIFVTAYDSYYIQALKNNGIDYLLKPYSSTDLINSIHKYQNIKDHLLDNKNGYESLQLNQKKNKVIVKKGQEFFSIQLNDVAVFYTDNKVVYLVDILNRKFITEYVNLVDIEKHLDEKIFFKANRKFIINLEHLKKFRRVDKSRIMLELTVPTHDPIIISQGNTIVFNKTIRSI